MLVREYTVEGKASRRKKALWLRCDHCKKEFERAHTIKTQLKKKRHYCSSACFALAMKSGGIADKSRKKTCQERYGSDYYIIRHDVASKSGKLAHTPEIEKRRWKKIREGWKDLSKQLSRGLTLIRSKQEVEFFAVIKKQFKVEAECPKYVNGWFIDGYISSHKVWVQYDGVYWHSRPELIARDKKQDEWFAGQGLTLVRVTDKEWNGDREKVLKRLKTLLEP